MVTTINMANNGAYFCEPLTNAILIQRICAEYFYIETYSSEVLLKLFSHGK